MKKFDEEILPNLIAAVVIVGGILLLTVGIDAIQEKNCLKHNGTFVKGYSKGNKCIYGKGDK